MRRFVSVLTGILLAILVPSVVYAQASIAGVVKDASGAVLPGVTVEAASPVLIEKVRSVVTDGSGQYRIVDLRPGTYSVTFTLTGFSVVKREGIELTGSFNATINADLQVGGLEETITVTGESPIVDTQSIRRQTTLDQRDSDDGADRAILGGDGGAHSRHRHAGRRERGHSGHAADDGVRRHGRPRATKAACRSMALNTGAALNGGGVSTYVADVVERGRSRDDDVRRIGRSRSRRPDAQHRAEERRQYTVSGQVYLSGVTRGMVGSNYSDELRAAGLSTPGKLIKQWDFTGGVGGPIKQGPDLVLRDRARRRPAPDDSRHLPESQRRATRRVGVHARHAARRRAAPRASSCTARGSRFRRRSATSSTSTGTGRCPATAPRSPPTATRAARSRTPVRSSGRSASAA